MAVRFCVHEVVQELILVVVLSLLSILLLYGVVLISCDVFGDSVCVWVFCFVPGFTFVVYSGVGRVSDVVVGCAVAGSGRAVFCMWP